MKRATPKALTPSQVLVIRNAILGWVYTTVSLYAYITTTTDSKATIVNNIVAALKPYGTVDKRDIAAFVSVVGADTTQSTLIQALKRAPSITDAVGDEWTGDPEHPSIGELASILIPDSATLSPEKKYFLLPKKAKNAK